MKEVHSEIDTFAKGNVISADMKAKICHSRPFETPSRKRKAKLILPASTQERGKLEIKEVQSEIDTFAKGNVISVDLKAKICHRRPSETPSRKRKANMILPVSTQERGKIEAKEVQSKGKLASTKNYIPSLTIKDVIFGKTRVLKYWSKKDLDEYWSKKRDGRIIDENCPRLASVIERDIQACPPEDTAQFNKLLDEAGRWYA